MRGLNAGFGRAAYILDSQLANATSLAGRVPSGTAPDSDRDDCRARFGAPREASRGGGRGFFEVGKRPDHHRSCAGRSLHLSWDRIRDGRPRKSLVPRLGARSFYQKKLHTRGSIDSEIRNRGIFSVPVYRLGLTVEGEFARPSFSELGVEPSTIGWDRAYLAVGISDTRAIQEETAVSWNDQKVSFLPGTGAFTDGGMGIHAVVGVADAMQRFKFSFPLLLNGSLSIYLTPFGQHSVVELQSDYSHPSFHGNWLPVERSVSADTFQAKWSIPFLGRNYPQAWRAGAEMGEAIDGSRFGVELVNLVDHYRMAERSVKYAGLFILLTFATVWLIEVLAGVRVHPIQYLILGGALCLFYLLELSLSEHVGFPLAYAMASISVIGMVTAYSSAVLHRMRLALLVTAGVALLYVYLYILLMNEDFALLIGSVGLFAILAVIMYVTRRVDWYSVGARPPALSGSS